MGWPSQCSEMASRGSRSASRDAREEEAIVLPKLQVLWVASKHEAQRSESTASGRVTASQGIRGRPDDNGLSVIKQLKTHIDPAAVQTNFERPNSTTTSALDRSGSRHGKHEQQQEGRPRVQTWPSVQYRLWMDVSNLPLNTDNMRQLRRTQSSARKRNRTLHQQENIVSPLTKQSALKVTGLPRPRERQGGGGGGGEAGWCDRVNGGSKFVVGPPEKWRVASSRAGQRTDHLQEGVKERGEFKGISEFSKRDGLEMNRDRGLDQEAHKLKIGFPGLPSRLGRNSLDIFLNNTREAAPNTTPRIPSPTINKKTNGETATSAAIATRVEARTRANEETATSTTIAIPVEARARARTKSPFISKSNKDTTTSSSITQQVKVESSDINMSHREVALFPKVEPIIKSPSVSKDTRDTAITTSTALDAIHNSWRKALKLRSRVRNLEGQRHNRSGWKAGQKTGQLWGMSSRREDTNEEQSGDGTVSRLERSVQKKQGRTPKKQLSFAIPHTTSSSLGTRKEGRERETASAAKGSGGGDVGLSLPAARLQDAYHIINYISIQ